jgi:hypothetical protein
MNWKLFVLATLITTALQADVSHGVLEKYRKNHKIFVGTGMGNYITIARAVNAGFEKIFSLEEDEVLVEHKKYLVPKDKNFQNYYAMQGNPASDLSNLVFSIDEPITIFLGTYFPDVDATPITNTILDELEQIRSHSISRHTILIDYIHHAGTELFGNLSLQDIKNKILEINSQYRFAFERGGHLEKEKDAILVAYLE